jgi:hypothetical protein
VALSDVMWPHLLTGTEKSDKKSDNAVSLTKMFDSKHALCCSLSLSNRIASYYYLKCLR